MLNESLEKKDESSRGTGGYDGRLKVQERTAVLTICAGLLMAFVALFLPPQGEISSSVCWIFAQCLIYAGSMLGVAVLLHPVLRRR